METLRIAQESAHKGEQIVQLLEKFGLFWNVNLVNLITPDEQPTRFYGTQREDTGDVFNCFTKNYTVLQNWELAELITEVAGKFDMDVAKGGMFNNGGKVYLQIATGTLKGIGINNDTVKKYITAINSHDGSTSLGFGMTNTTISCANTFHAAYRSVENKIRHTSSMKDRVDALSQQFAQVQEDEKTLYEKFFKLADAPAGINEIQQVVQMTTAVDLNQKVEDNDYSTYQLNQAKQLAARISEEMTIKGETLWGLFSGVTKYTNRDLRYAKRDNAVEESKFLGSAGKHDNKVFNYLSTIIS
jgi:hypothetical protein